MKYKGWVLRPAQMTLCPFKFEAYDPEGEKRTKYSNLLDELVAEIEEEGEQ